jgi:hypothetical protein
MFPPLVEEFDDHVVNVEQLGFPDYRMKAMRYLRLGCSAVFILL